jgi:hypothetical protein
MHVTKALATFLLLATGCATSLQPEIRCHELEARYEAWGAVAAAAGAVAGGGAITTALPPDDPALRLTLGLSSAAVLALGTAAVFVAQDLLAAYTTDGCSGGGASTSTVGR